MRGWAYLTLSLVAALVIGVGVEAAVQPHSYALHGHSFTAAFPGAPFTTPEPPRHLWSLEYHGVVEPPLYEVTVLALGPPLSPGERPSGSGYAGFAMRVKLRRPADVTQDIPSVQRTGTWTLPPLAGFRRTVTTYLGGPANFRVSIGDETLTRGRLAYSVTAQAQSYSSVRAFLESFAPID